jgi:hypothetical protein
MNPEEQAMIDLRSHIVSPSSFASKERRRATAVVLVALSAALVPGCAGTAGPATAPPGGISAWDACLGPPPREPRGEKNQGPDLTGALVTGSEKRYAFVRTFQTEGMVTASGVPIQKVRVVRGALVGEVASPSGPVELTGAGWKDVRLHAVLDCADGATHRPLEATIADAYHDPQRAEADAWLYHVKILDDPASKERWACDPDDKGDTGAIPLDGVWDAHGEHQARTGAFSFACTGAAAAKCVRWGYRPWELAEAGHPAPRDMHAACTRMTRADYCGDGRSATAKGTTINLWDRENRTKRGATPDGFSFEAAWTPAGAVCMGHARWPKRTSACADRKGPGLNEYNVPVCGSQAEAEALAGAGKVLFFDESASNE